MSRSGAPPGAVRVRVAEPADGTSIAAIDRRVWSPAITPGPRPDAGTDAFSGSRRPPDVLVAVLAEAVVGYVALARPTPLASNAHVLEIVGLAVDPDRQRAGTGRRLLAAAADEARNRGARRLRLRVLGPNRSARRLYAAAGFVEEGVLRGEFELSGLDVDDHLLALDLTPRPS